MTLKPGDMSLDALMSKMIVQEVFQHKTLSKTAGGLAAQTSSHKVKTAGQTSQFVNRQLTRILKLKVKPGLVLVLKSTTSFWIQRRPLRGLIYCELPPGYFGLCHAVVARMNT